jgi:hypothetical protein
MTDPAPAVQRPGMSLFSLLLTSPLSPGHSMPHGRPTASQEEVSFPSLFPSCVMCLCVRVCCESNDQLFAFAPTFCPCVWKPGKSIVPDERRKENEKKKRQQQEEDRDRRTLVMYSEPLLNPLIPTREGRGRSTWNTGIAGVVVSSLLSVCMTTLPEVDSSSSSSSYFLFSCLFSPIPAAVSVRLNPLFLSSLSSSSFSFHGNDNR